MSDNINKNRLYFEFIFTICKKTTIIYLYKDKAEGIVSRRLKDTGINYNFKYITHDNGLVKLHNSHNKPYCKMYIEFETEDDYNIFIMNFDNEDNFIQLCNKDEYENMRGILWL